MSRLMRWLWGASLGQKALTSRCKARDARHLALTLLLPLTHHRCYLPPWGPPLTCLTAGTTTSVAIARRPAAGQVNESSAPRASHPLHARRHVPLTEETCGNERTTTRNAVVRPYKPNWPRMNTRAIHLTKKITYMCIYYMPMYILYFYTYIYILIVYIYMYMCICGWLYIPCLPILVGQTFSRALLEKPGEL